MGRLLAREAALILLSGMFGWLVLPAMMGKPPLLVLFWAGLVMSLTFMAMYAMSVMAGNKMPARVRHWLGPIAWVGAFLPELALLFRLMRDGATLNAAALYLSLAPALFGLLLTGLGAALAPVADRKGVALSTLYAYSFPMLAVVWLLVPMVGVNPLAAALARQSGAIYMALRVLVRIFWPGSVEGDASAPPLVVRRVPDPVVGLVEGLSRRRARPFATLPGGALDEGAISVLALPDEVREVVTRLEGALADRPFRVCPGESVDGRVEIVVRPQP
ncbi:MAG: hypothetical protein JWN15_3151 [Firmicutes bacterium]|nr:hypothetical protein [Bacillota bacterium]